MMLACTTQLATALFWAMLAADASPRVMLDEARFRVETPAVVLTGVPVNRLRITALDAYGEFDPTYQGRPLIEGVRLVVAGEETALPPFRNGVLELTTDLQAGRKVYITDSRIVVDPQSRGRKEAPVWRTLSWFSLVPPLLAAVLAAWLRNAIVAFFAGLWSAAVIFAQGNLATAFLRTLDTHIVGALVHQNSAGVDHMPLLLFLTFFGAALGVMTAAGGLQGLAERLARLTKTREHAQTTAWLATVLVFVDRAVGMFVAGSALRAATDRLKISREKLAFLLDGTGGAISSLAVATLFTATVLGSIEAAYSGIHLPADPLSMFVQSLPYQFYALHLLVFVWLVAYSGRDFGPMLRAEMRAVELGEVTRPAAIGSFERAVPATEGAQPLARNALIPLGVFVVSVLLGLGWSGWESTAVFPEPAVAHGQAAALVPASEACGNTLWSVFSGANAFCVLMLSACIASIAAVTSAVVWGTLSLTQALAAWMEGAERMFPTIVILALAWAIATACDAEHLNTAGFLAELFPGRVPAGWMPASAFVLAGLHAYLTGSTWPTIALLLPLFLSMAHALLPGIVASDPAQPVLLATLSGVLAGALWGSHCSPLSETTVLASAAACCDHADHVLTQSPYALAVAAVAIVFGYVPAGFGYSPVYLLPLGVGALYVLVQFLGRTSEEMIALRDSALTPAPPALAGAAAGPNLDALDL